MTNVPFRASAIHALDELLRGKLTDASQVRVGLTPVRLFGPWALALGAIYGSFMAWYAIAGGAPNAWLHLLYLMIKLPALFLLTLGVTFPSLYVFNALMGCGLGFRATLRLLVATIVVNLALAASLGPILAFFTVSTTSYTFIVLLNVALLGIAGIVSIGFLLRALIKLQEDEASKQTEQASGADELISRRSVTGMFFIWIVTYALVGSQMGWLLRPFIGHPGQELTFLRARSGSFIESVWNSTAGQLDPGKGGRR
ncbi:MAG: hypothetical protein KF691_14655 [Phycisphaeraceae bacterium]|nr:hypothetical protein [Phycisphaeraceae bacterium]